MGIIYLTSQEAKTAERRIKMPKLTILIAIMAMLAACGGSGVSPVQAEKPASNNVGRKIAVSISRVILNQSRFLGRHATPVPTAFSANRFDGLTSISYADVTGGRNIIPPNIWVRCEPLCRYAQPGGRYIHTNFTLLPEGFRYPASVIRNKNPRAQVSHFRYTAASAIELGALSISSLHISAGAMDYSAFLYYDANWRIRGGGYNISAEEFGVGAAGDRFFHRPARGTWRGEARGRVGNRRSEGNAVIVYDSGDNALDAGFSLQGRSDAMWFYDVPINSVGSFFQNRGERWLDGDFYGYAGQEAAGVFQYDDVIAAFGARQE